MQTVHVTSTDADRLHRPDCTPLVLTVLGAAVVTIALLLDPTPAAETLLGMGLALSAGGPLVRIADYVQRGTPIQPQPDDGDDGDGDGGDDGDEAEADQP